MSNGRIANLAKKVYNLSMRIDGGLADESEMNALMAKYSISVEEMIAIDDFIQSYIIPRQKKKGRKL